MNNPFVRRRRGDDVAKTGSLPSNLRRGAYTLELPRVGTGHYVPDPDGSLDPWCDLDQEQTAREEFHWHARILSEHGANASDVREATEPMISGLQQKQGVRRRAAHESEMSKLKGSVESVESRVGVERAKASMAKARETTLREEAERERQKVAEKWTEHDALPLRLRLNVTLRLTITLSGSFFIFDVGIIGNAFELISGALPWKIVLALGVAMAPLSTAIGIALWLSAAEHSIRKDRAAGRFALIAGVTAVIGLILIVPFRAAASGDAVIGPLSFSFLAFIQVALGMAETMIYTVYFDSRVGVAMRKQIAIMAMRPPELERLADREVQRREAAEQSIEQIKENALQQKHAIGQKEEALRETPDEDFAQQLRGVVTTAILEGEAGRRQHELRDLDAGPLSSDLESLSWAAYTALAVSVLSIFGVGVQLFS